MQKASHILGLIGAFVLRLTLTATDLYINYLIRIRANERAVPRTRRIRFPSELRQRISQRQAGLCMYCGVRLSRSNLHIDHIFPAEHGGSNAESNLQALCAPCNIRKGVQTDSEFRTRYRALLRPAPAGRRQSPPRTRIPQSKFRKITARTGQSGATRARRIAVFKTPQQKITSGSAITGVAAGVVWLVVMSMFFDDNSDVGAYVAVFGGIAVGLTTAIVLIWRAKYTGRFDQ